MKMSIKNKVGLTDISGKKKSSRLLLVRSIFLLLFFVIVLNFVLLIPSLNSVSDRFYEHQEEVVERIDVELGYLLVKELKNNLHDIATLSAVQSIISSEGGIINHADILTFLDDKKYISKYAVSTFLGEELFRVENGKIAESSELKNVSDTQYFKLAQTMDEPHITINYDGNDPYILLSDQFSVGDGSFYGVLKIEVDIKNYIKGFSNHLREEEHEFIYVIDNRGFVAEHYDPSKIGKSVSDIGVETLYNTAFSSSDHEVAGDYKNKEGERMQVMLYKFEPFNFVIAVEESYASAWGAWRQILLLSSAGIVMFTLLSIFLVKNTISMIYVSEELFRKKQQTETIISNLVSGIIQYDKNFRILVVNPAASDMLGINKNDVIGKVITSDTIKEDPRYESLVKVLYPSLAENVKKIQTDNEEVKVMEMSISKPSETELQVSTISILDGKDIIGYLKVLRDISREKAISKTKSEFISIAAHQLRTPLSAIKWIFKMLIDGDAGKLTKEQIEFVQKGYDSNERIIQLVGDMLNVARIEEGRFGYEFYYVDIVGLINKNISSVSLKAEEKKIELKFKEPKEKFKPLKIDPARIDLVLQNLLDNALKYTPEKGKISVELKKKDNDFVQISVKDNGVGVPKDQIGRLFSKFFRGANVIKLQTDGSGLGLFITKNIIRRHGGDIGVTSEKDGTEFTFTLPINENLIPKKESSLEDAIDL